MASSAGKNNSTASSAKVMSRGVPKVVSVVNSESSSPSDSTRRGTNSAGSSHPLQSESSSSAWKFGDARTSCSSSWDLVGPDGAVVLAGVDVGDISEDGRLQRITGFFGDLAVLETV